MIKKLQKHGNSHALVIDKALMEAMGITPDSELQVTLNGSSLQVTPANVGVGEERVDEIMRDLRPKYDQMLKNLAE